MNMLTLKLSDELNAQLALVAKRNHKTKSDVVRQALEAYLNGVGKAGKGTIADLAADLIGSLEGPGDLSHNPQYMDDFGK
jgi:Arc/MetJ-type ribon-helix-helix transcriptional regulator